MIRMLLSFNLRNGLLAANRVPLKLSPRNELALTKMTVPGPRPPIPIPSVVGPTVISMLVPLLGAKTPWDFRRIRKFDILSSAFRGVCILVGQLGNAETLPLKTVDRPEKTALASRTLLLELFEKWTIIPLRAAIPARLVTTHPHQSNCPPTPKTTVKQRTNPVSLKSPRAKM